MLKLVDNFLPTSIIPRPSSLVATGTTQTTLQYPIATHVTVRELHSSSDGGDGVPPGFEGAAVLSLPPGCTWLSQPFQHLFKRDFYDRFITVLLNNFNFKAGFTGALLIGTPGIGKSSFAMYAIWKALELGKTVVYQHYGNPTDFTVLRPDQAPVEIVGTLPPAAKDPSAVFIADSIPPHDANIKAFQLFVSSPSHDRVHEWMKLPTRKLFAFPTLSLQELRLMRDACYDGSDLGGALLSDESLQERMDKVGGVPRFIFQPRENFSEGGALDTSMAKSAKRAVDTVMRLDFENTSMYHTSHRALHFVVSRELERV